MSRGDRPANLIHACRRESEPRIPASITVISSSRTTYTAAPISATRWTRSATSVFDKCRDVIAGELVAAFEGGKLDEEGEPDDLSLELFHELDRPRHRAARREKVVDDQDARAGFDRVLVHLEGRRSGSRGRPSALARGTD